MVSLCKHIAMNQALLATCLAVAAIPAFFSRPAAAGVALNENWAGRPVGAVAAEFDGWALAYGDKNAATLQEVGGKRALAFAAGAENTAIAFAQRWPLGREGSISVTARIRDLPEAAGPAGAMLRGYNAGGKRIDSYWFLFDAGQRAVLIKRGKDNLARVNLNDIRKALNAPGWSAADAHTYRLDVAFEGERASLQLFIDGASVATVQDDDPPARFATAELLLFSFNGNDVAYESVKVAIPAPAQSAQSPAEEADAGDPVAARRALARSVRHQYARRGESLSIHSVRASAPSVGLYERFELSFQVDGAYANPFDPDEVRVDAQITRPDGSTVTVPAFFMHPYESTDGRTRLESNVTYQPAGEPGWRLRYAPTQAGRHIVRLTAALGATGQTAESQPIAFEAAPSDHPGYVRISPDNPLYFERTADRSLFYPTGVNLPWTRTRQRSHYTGEPEKDYEYYFSKAAGQMSGTRVWQCHYAWLEWMPVPGEPADNSWSGYGGLNHYNQMVASAFDRVFELAEQARVPVMLVLDDNDEHQQAEKRHAWPFNPYNVINGGPCEDPTGVFTSPEAQRAYRNRVRYILARWGYSPALWALNSWNDRVGAPPEVVAWLRGIHDYVHDLVGDWRPVIYGTNFRFDAQAISDYAQAEKGGLVPGKPNVIQEGYFTTNRKWFVETLREEVWTNLARGRGGVMIWPHPLVDQADAWSEFRAVTDFLKGVPLHRQVFEPVDARVISAKAIGTGAMRALALAPYGDVPMWGVKATRERFSIDARGGSQFLEGMARKLYGQRRDRLAWRTTPTFLFDLPGEGNMIIEVGELAGSGMHLVATDRGRPLVDIPLEGEGRRRPSADQHFLRIPLAAGPHELAIGLEGPASDWLEIRKLVLVYRENDPTRILDAYGLASRDHAMLYLRNATRGELQQDLLGQDPVAVEDVAVEVRGLKRGAYRVAVFDIERGDVTHQYASDSDGSRLRLHLPKVDREAAVKIVPAGASELP